MTGRVHPAIDNAARCGVADGEVFSDQAIVVAAFVGPREGIDPIGRDMIEVMLRKHIADAIACGERELLIQIKRAQSVSSALAIHGVDELADNAGVDKRRCCLSLDTGDRVSSRQLGMTRSKGPIQIARKVLQRALS